jgi:hypothetical protein
MSGRGADVDLGDGNGDALDDRLGGEGLLRVYMINRRANPLEVGDEEFSGSGSTNHLRHPNRPPLSLRHTPSNLVGDRWI